MLTSSQHRKESKVSFSFNPGDRVVTGMAARSATVIDTRVSYLVKLDNGATNYCFERDMVPEPPKPVYTIRPTERCFAVDHDGKTLAWFKSRADAEEFAAHKGAK